MVHGDLFCEVCRLHSETSWWDELVVYVIGGASRCESESGSVRESSEEILCCDVGSSCVTRCCSGFDYGYENVSNRSWGCEGRPSLCECRASHPEHTNRRAGLAKELLDYINCG